MSWQTRNVTIFAPSSITKTAATPTFRTCPPSGMPSDLIRQQRSGMAAFFPRVTQRGLMLAQYLVYARTKRWAWDGLDRLHQVLMQRGDEIPDVLQKHINEAYHGLLTRPLNPNRSPEFSPQDDRDFRIMLVIRDLRKRRTREQAIADVAEATGAKEAKVESVVRKMERFWSEAVERATKRVN